jgi:hypothetical protein
VRQASWRRGGTPGSRQQRVQRPAPAHAAPAAARIDCLHCVLLLQGVGIDGSMAQQKQTVKQAMKDMAKNTFSKSK